MGLDALDRRAASLHAGAQSQWQVSADSGDALERGSSWHTCLYTTFPSPLQTYRGG